MNERRKFELFIEGKTIQSLEFCEFRVFGGEGRREAERDIGRLVVSELSKFMKIARSFAYQCELLLSKSAPICDVANVSND